MICHAYIQAYIQINQQLKQTVIDFYNLEVKMETISKTHAYRKIEMFAN